MVLYIRYKLARLRRRVVRLEKGVVLLRKERRQNITVRNAK